MRHGDRAALSSAASPKRSADAFERERIRLGVQSRVFGAEPTPLRLGRYTILDRIAAGGTSLVYLAYDDQLDRRVAIKLLLGDSTDLRMRLTREGRTLARLDHPGTVRVHDVGTDEALAFMVIELVEGETLADWLSRGHQDWTKALELMLPVGDALDAAHRVGLIHRDVKPANILLDERGTPRLADFGFTRELASDTSGARLRLAAHDGVTTTVGTPAYMAPEQWDGSPCDARTDQFGYCVTLFEALFGERPFAGDSRPELKQHIQSDNPQVPDGSTVPDWLRAIVLRGLERDPGSRFGTLDELLTEIRACQQSVRQFELAQINIGRLQRMSDPSQRRELGVIARRALDEAIDTWSANDDAHALRSELLVLLFHEALARADLADAEAIFPSLHDDGTLGARLAEAREKAEAPTRRLETLEHERNTRLEETFKAKSIALTAVGWTVGYAAYAVADRMDALEVTPMWLVPFYLFYALAGLIALRTLPAKYAANRVNRELTIVSSLVASGHVVTMVASSRLDASTGTALMFTHVLAATAYAIAGLAYDRRAAWLTPTNLIGALCIALWPAWALEIAAAVVPVGSAAWAFAHLRSGGGT